MSLLNRRQLITRSALLGLAASAIPSVAFAQAPTSRRLLFVLQRGAADGLGTLAPVGDPDFERLRKGWTENALTGMRTDSMFALHPKLAQVGQLYGQKQALFVHATASSYRERSHFDAQNLLETGGSKAYQLRDGWLNRLIGLFGRDTPRALALAQAIPLALQGAQSASSYAPTNLPEASRDLIGRVSALYESDPQLSALWQTALETRAMAGDTQMRNLRDADATGKLAASLMTGTNAARIMMVESDGWDSHQGQPNQLGGALERLDTFLGAFKNGMGADWRETLVIVATEFGRTAKVNGTNGTDHGTASAAMLLGGAVAGGRVLSDWPGLSDKMLHEGRDLAPTTPLEAVLAGAISGHFNLDPSLVMTTLFPARTMRSLTGLMRG